METSSKKLSKTQKQVKKVKLKKKERSTTSKLKIQRPPPSTFTSDPLKYNEWIIDFNSCVNDDDLANGKNYNSSKGAQAD